MSLAALPLSPARVFAELLAPPLGGRGRESEPVPGLPGGRSAPVPPGREVHVSGSAELRAAPDRARVSIRLGSRKGEAGEARSSVSRRLEYIAQSARQRGVQEENVTVTKDFRRVENAYQMEAEVCITFSDFGKMQNICNLLVEKLGSSVIISPPHFYHTAEAVDTLRRQVCLAAVGNTRRKAQEVCRLFGQSLGKPLLIREEEMKEWEGQIDSHPSNSSDTLTVQQRIQSATIYASSKVFAIFEIKGREKRKNKLI
ncbi:interleukin-1 receptor-associated kinase 1-binding protein 1 [Chelonia mydas]|uniref:interleukin-1 receptor-associated kinase 1-binding protein 1 n=1 Tax=Chelonia mydas TaxID=8469 RepID=UPI0018A1CFB3|nr:interleukin-1 receptor-associated kinase 1-binding protein 1 [Chelonia mydas]